MKVEMVMPQMGESIAEGTILRWLKKAGERVEKDENILEISTDKVDSEIPAPAAGVLAALLAQEGETVPVGQVIAHIDTEAKAPGAGKAAPRAQAPRAESKGASVPPPSTERPAPAPAPSPAGQRPAPSPAPPPTVDVGSLKAIPSRDAAGRFLSPLVRAVAQTEGVSLEDLQGMPGSGHGGRITKGDILAFVEKRKGGPAAVPQPKVPSAPDVRMAPAPGAPAGAGKGERGGAFPQKPIAGRERRTTPEGIVEVVAMDHIRQKIAEHMVRSKATSPHVASVTEAEMTRIARYREAEKGRFEREEGFKLTYTPFFVAAVVAALKEFPIMNASIDGNEILVKRFVHIGLAVSVDYGLIVPVIRGADSLSFLGIARAVHDLATRARSKALKPEEVTGGTFSITNMGTVGTLFGIPIIAQPQVGILGIGAIQKRAVVRDDAIAIREMVTLCLSYDHRLIDGATGGGFVERVAHHLETMEL